MISVLGVPKLTFVQFGSRIPVSHFHGTDLLITFRQYIEICFSNPGRCIESKTRKARSCHGIELGIGHGYHAGECIRWNRKQESAKEKITAIIFTAFITNRYAVLI